MASSSLQITQNSDSAARPAQTAPEKARRMWVEAGIIFALLALNALCFFRSLRGYFLADDFVHVGFLWTVFHGHADLLWRNFLTNWMEAEGTRFYRPLISLTLASDYAIWGARAFGFHLTNLLLQMGSTVFLFLCSRRLFSWGTWADRTVMALLAASLFAVYPLHPEVVSWIIARVDSVTTLFYLAAFWLFLKGRQIPWSEKKSISSRFPIAFSLTAFALALLSKEMAVTLPPVLFTYCLFEAAPGNLKSRLKEACRSTWAYWLLLVVYLAIRTAALGTATGGYGGSIGAGLTDSMMGRITNTVSLNHVLFPLSDPIFPPRDRLRQQLSLIYWAALAVISWRTVNAWRFKKMTVWLKQLSFAALWFILSMLPTLPVWDLTENLQGSRFIYLGSAPLALLLALLLFPVGKAFGERPDEVKLGALERAALAVGLALVLCYGQAAYRNNQAWVHASQQLLKLKAALDDVLTSTPENLRVALLNLPQRVEGAHVVYNGATFGVMLVPPLSDRDYLSRVLTFEPITYGEPDLVEPSRLRQLAAGAEPAHPSSGPLRLLWYRWNALDEKLQPFTLETSKPGTKFDLSAGLPLELGSNPNQALESPSVNVPALSVDFVDVDISSVRGSQSPDASKNHPVLLLSWAGGDGLYHVDQQLSLPLDQSKLRFLVSEHKSWVGAGPIKRVRLQVLNAPEPVTVASVKLLSGADQIAQLSPSDQKNSQGRRMTPDQSGVCRPGAKLGRFNYDVSNIAGATGALYEVSPPDSWFEHYSGHFLDNQPAANPLFFGRLPSTRGSNIELQLPHPITAPGFYQLRLGAVDKNGHLLGYLSDPLNLQLSGEDLKAQR